MAASNTASPTSDRTVVAVHRLTMMREQHPELHRRVAEARIQLAAAIIELDEVDARIAGGGQIHSLQEQHAVELAQRAFGQALADLLRGEQAA